MKNITVSVPEAVYRMARVRAAEAGTSVSALVAKYLAGLGGDATESRRLEAQQRAIQADIVSFSAGSRLARDEVHRRAPR